MAIKQNPDRKRAKAQKRSKLYYLNRAEFSEVKHFSSFRDAINSPGHLPTHVRISDARTDLGPVAVAGDTVGEPGVGVVGEGVVQVGPVQDGLAGALGGDGVGEDDEADEGGDDEEHGPQVEVHQEAVSVARAGEARE